MEGGNDRYSYCSHDETALLASIGTELKSQAEYESAVIGEAVNRDVPLLTGVSFPDLSSLVPMNGAGAYLPHVLTTLRKIRKLWYSLADSDSDEAHLVQMKYQILLWYLTKDNSSVSDEDIHHDVEHEFLAERKRKRKLQFSEQNSWSTTSYNASRKLEQKTPSESVLTGKEKLSGPQLLEHIKNNFCDDDIVCPERGSLDASSIMKALFLNRREREDMESSQILSTSCTASFGKQALMSREASIAVSRHKASSQKLNLMNSKRKIVEDEGGVWIDPVELWKKREARRERRRLKKMKENFQENEYNDVQHETECEFEPCIASKKPRSTKTNKKCSLSRRPKPIYTPCDHSENLTEELQNTVFCSVCEKTIQVPISDKGSVDEFLCQHMSSCRGTSRVLRSSLRNQKRQVLVQDLGKELCSSTSDSSDETICHRNHTDICGSHKSEQSSVERNKATDDYNQDDYEDRVDEFLDIGLKNIKLKLQQESDNTHLLKNPTMYPGGLIVPSWINNRLFGYQRTGVRWMWELFQQGAGGIVGDEMGLGKTVQVCAFLGAMTCSRKLKSVIIVCPATMMIHWLNELALWAPSLRRVMIHNSADKVSSGRKISRQLLEKLEIWLRCSRMERLYEAIDEDDYNNNDPDIFCGTGYVIVTTYDNLRLDAKIWLNHDFSIVILDEGQRIRNPDAEVTLVCKRLRTPHRYLLSGTPIQNDLRELWSLFDFVCPGKLGTLPSFETEFADIIKRGGYINASPMQVALGYRCALVLREMIKPYLLRRQKKDVDEISRLPGKTEQILFCRLTKRQRLMYESYLTSEMVQNAIRGTGQLFKPIIVLRKICNHPDLVCGPNDASFQAFLRNGFENISDNDSSSDEDGEDLYRGTVFETENLVERSGKLKVLSKILPLWFRQGHRVLIFSQWKKTLNIIQRFTRDKGWNMMRMDGSTNIGSRQSMVDKFNGDSSIFGMLMTTRTGGVGLNLTGANRIILFDPDWNPQTDAQARERSWRFGQTRSVTIYRLIVAGTIEEKIYHRQIFKTALTNQILADPRQRRLFSKKDLKDLFTLKPDVGTISKDGDGITLTGEITKGIGVINDISNNGCIESSDDKNTLEAVFRCKGVAGVFDHDVIDKASSKVRKSLADLEMDEKAMKVATNAAKKLASSHVESESFIPTWTGSKETEIRRFGGVQTTSFQSQPWPNHSSAGLNNTQTVSGSAVLLANWRTRTDSIRLVGSEVSTDAMGFDEDWYRRLSSSLQNFLLKSKSNPTTERILQEFAAEYNNSPVGFRKALKIVAEIRDGKWYLI